MKKRLIFSNYDNLKNPYYAGGGAIAIHELAKKLVKKYDVKVITGKYPNSKDEIIDGVKYQHIGIAKISPKLNQLIFSLLLPYYVASQQFEVWFESFTPPFSTNFLPLFSKKPVVGITHFLSAKEKSNQYKLPFHWIEKIGLQTYKYIVVLTNTLRDQVLLSNPDLDVTVIPNGINIESCPKRPTKIPKKYFLFIGRLEIEQKGIDLLLEAFAKVANQVNIDLYIAGSGMTQAKKRIHEMIVQNHLEKNVKLLGKVSGQKKKLLYCHAFFLALPSRFETFSMTALEALTANKPILCFDIPNLSWINMDAAIKVPAFSVEKYAEGILQLVTDDKLCEKLSENTKKLAKNYDWDQIAQKYTNLIEQLTS